jgi:hypothetical protein
MSLYPKQSMQMLVDLINASNPTLPVPLTASNALYGTPTVITPAAGTIQNTSIKVTALAGTKYVGNTTLKYRRIDFGTLFRSLPIVIYKYSPATVGQNPYKISDLLPSLNAKYGLNLQTTDIVDGFFPVGNTAAVPAIGLAAGTRNASVTVTAATGSPGYVGSFTFYWVQAPQDIAGMISVTNLETARAYPGGRSVVDSSVHVVDLDTYSYDFTTPMNAGAAAIGQSLATFLNFATTVPLDTTTAPYTTAIAQVIAMIVQASGVAYNNTPPASTNLSLAGITAKRFTLPNAAVPEADSKYFNNCLVIDLLTANTWGAGRMILHFNI